MYRGRPPGGLMFGSLPRVENIVIFVSDSLRWDCMPDAVKRLGLTVKTIASSTFTAAAFPSIVSGLYPCHHRTYSFYHELPVDVPNLLGLPGYNTSLWTETAWVQYDPPETAPIYKVLRQKARIALRHIEPPFIYMENDKGGHSPYGSSFEDYKGDNAHFYRSLGGNKREMAEKYQQSIDASVRVFARRMDELHSRNLADRTLVIFTSDHGELLGEYGGLAGHEWPICPELVYVPTTFIHPSLEPGIAEGTMNQVDIAPTSLGALNQGIPEVMYGSNLVEGTRSGIGCTHFRSYIHQGVQRLLLDGAYEAWGVWDGKGGHVFHTTAFMRRLFYALTKLSRKEGTNFIWGGFQRQPSASIFPSLLEVLRHSTGSHIVYGRPHFTCDDAQEVISQIRKRHVCHGENLWGLGDEEETIKRLRGLGYLD